MKRVIHWFRRDLRISDNTALYYASQQADEVIPVYILSTWKRTHSWTGPNRQAFLCGCLSSLNRQISTRLPPPLVDHAQERVITLERFRRAATQSADRTAETRRKLL